MLGGQSRRQTVPSGLDVPLWYVPELDGIRGLAVLAVVAVHAGFPRSGGGAFGVDIFFVLSGFLITSQLLREHDRTGRISLRRFCARRALRLMPALLVLLAVCLLYGLVFPKSNQGRETAEAVPLSLFYVANMFRALGLHDLGLLEHTWSLSIEEHFYIVVAPLLVLILALGVRLRIVGVVFISIAALVATYRAIHWARGGSFIRLYCGSDTRMDGLLLGVAMAALLWAGVVPRSVRARRSVQGASIFAVVALAVLIVATDVRQSAYQPFFFGGGLFLVALLATAVIYQVVTVPIMLVSRVLTMRGLLHIGRISYGVYLWHVPMLRAFDDSTLVEKPVFVTLRIAATLVVAELSFRYIEQPFLRRKHRLGAAAEARSTGQSLTEREGAPNHPDDEHDVRRATDVVDG